MAKPTKNEFKLQDEEWDTLVRQFLRKMAQTATRNRGAATTLSKAINKSKSAVVDMKTEGTGSVVSWVRMAMHVAGISDAEAKEMLQDPAILMRNRIEMPSQLESLIHELRRHYDENELAAWMTLLLSKRQVEDDLGVTLKAALKKDFKTKRE